MPAATSQELDSQRIRARKAGNRLEPIEFAITGKDLMEIGQSVLIYFFD